MRRLMWCSALALLSAAPASAQDSARVYTRADTLRGDWTTPARAWWDVTFYDLHVAVSPGDSTIRGWNGITYRVLAPGSDMQIDLKTPLGIDSMIQNGTAVPFRREGDAFFASLTAPQQTGALHTITVYFHGHPRPAKNAPWDGGFSWRRDSLGHDWDVTTDQGVGASLWWPNKDTQADEPDSQRIAITVPDPMVDVSNGRLRSVAHHADGTTTWEWFVVNPINNYGVAVNAGAYTHFSDTFQGERGLLTLDYWPLSYHLEAAERQFVQARSMLACFEHWFGPYPWYEDGYKLVEVPHNGMEHQSGIAYGNRYANGYQHRDLSGTGLGMQWDFIIVHESAHEWFGNNISSKDLADMWVHESFANYAEGLYTECLFGKEAGARYIIGSRRGIQNDRPVVPAYGVNAEGSGDMYPKGGNMLHTIRQIVNDDEKWRGILRGLNATFRHQTVMGSQVEDYISREAGIDLSKVFAQYLTTTQIPELQYRIRGDSVAYRWANVVRGFDMPVRVKLSAAGFTVIHPSAVWQSSAFALGGAADLAVDENFYVTSRRLEGAASR